MDRLGPVEDGGRGSLQAFLATLRGRTVYYCSNPGNGGDSLIAIATFHLFDEAGIRYNIVRWDADVDLTGQIVLYAGGGNLVGLYRHARTFVERHHRTSERLILLPCTVRKNEDLLAQLGSNTEIMCRERCSYAHVRRAAPGARVQLMDDVALSLDVERILRADVGSIWSTLGRSAWHQTIGSRVGGAVRLRTLLRCLKERAEAETRRVWADSRSDVLNCFRTDREKTRRAIPADNLDLSRVFSFGTDSPDVALLAAHSFLTYIDRYEEVRTNRLHACIGAALLGKRVRLHANSYFKNEAVFEYSLRDRFENVIWMS